MLVDIGSKCVDVNAVLVFDAAKNIRNSHQLVPALTQQLCGHTADIAIALDGKGGGVRDSKVPSDLTGDKKGAGSGGFPAEFCTVCLNGLIIDRSGRVEALDGFQLV